MSQTTDIKGELSKRAGRQKKDTDIPAPTPSQDPGLQEDGSIRLLRADEIECRVSTINVYGLRLLLYKDARVDQKILDKVFTPFRWQRTHQEIDGNLYCTVSVWDSNCQQWISKQDVGTASYSDKEKGQASDSFKRACFNWGIGRELYTAPDIWIPAGRTHIKEHRDKKGHYVTTDRFSVQSITYDRERKISSLVITDQDGKIVFQMHQETSDIQQDRIAPSEDHTSIQMELLQRELERTGISLRTVLERYNIQDIRQLTPELLDKALNGLRKTKTKGAA